MSVTIPTAASIKMRFPEFADVDDYVIEFAIEEARLDVGDNWTTGADIAIVYLTAHYVSSAVAAQTGGGNSGDIVSESIGRLSVTYAQNTTASQNAGATPDDKESTTYGRRYLEILEGNFAGARIA